MYVVHKNVNKTFENVNKQTCRKNADHVKINIFGL